MVHTAAGPGEWGKRETEIFPLDSHWDGGPVRIEKMVLQGMMVQSIINLIYFI